MNFKIQKLRSDFYYFLSNNIDNLDQSWRKILQSIILNDQSTPGFGSDDPFGKDLIGIEVQINYWLFYHSYA